MADKDKEETRSRDGRSDDDDYAYEKQARREQIPDAVDHFLGSLLAALQTRNIPEIHRLYEDTFNKLTDRHYKSTKWPSVETVMDQVSTHPLFLILYKELYYRHMFARAISVTFEDRKGSWENYCKLLDLIISDLQEGENLTVGLPPQWIWDILDEFIYHYQTYCMFRSKAVKIQRDKEIADMKDNPEVFHTTRVLMYMETLVRCSRIEDYLKDPESGSGGAFSDETARLLGYFALMQLLRMHSLLGDYHLAMQTIECIDIHEEVPLFYKIPACHVTLYYYMGFAYLMMRRYADSIRTFGDILVFLSKTSGVNSLSYQYDAMVKKQDQMYGLMLVGLALSPRQVDESLEKTIRDKHAEKQARLQRGEELAFEELFSYACPKFVSAAAPNFEQAALQADSFNANEAHQRQLKLFLQEMKQQQFLPRIGSYMKLYTAIKTSKLAQLCEMDEEGLRDQLMCVMHKTSQKVRQKGAPLAGEDQLCGEVEFYLDGDMVHINSQRTEREHADVFLEQILKFQDLLKKMGKA
uniref:Eukaryotic translation initiation factor 3 subunit L n=1 Tax=Strombidinopsis acuminata TaxID=141414 RepID=A0A7S3T7U8_9SPIT|mmetsp:Transcript_28052/g.70987  ORF Transcript_28052/g.70987 Transcript_28052/m.70987 type:complete len:525 (+) Transcript_28052:48-1622(+)